MFRRVSLDSCSAYSNVELLSDGTTNGLTVIDAGTFIGFCDERDARQLGVKRELEHGHRRGNQRAVLSALAEMPISPSCDVESSVTHPLAFTGVSTPSW